MKAEEIFKKLEILSIISSDQLEKNQLDFWWQKKYKEIKDSQLKEETIKEKLMEINEVYEELSKVDEELLVEIINKKSKEENTVISDIDLYNLGVEHFNEKEYEVSIKKFSEAINLKSDDQDYFNLRGWAYYYLKKNDKAIKDATRAIELNSDDPDNFNLRAYARRGIELENKKYLQLDKKEIIQKLNLLGINSPNQLEEEDLIYWWQNAYKEIKDCQLEEETIEERLIEINQIFDELDTLDKDKIKEMLTNEDLDKTNPDLDPDIISFLEQGNISLEEGEYSKAVRNYNYAIRYLLKYQVERSSVYYKRGISKWKSGTYYSKEDILNDLQKAIELEPENSTYLLTLYDYQYSIFSRDRKEYDIQYSMLSRDRQETENIFKKFKNEYRELQEKYRELLVFNGYREIFYQRGLENKLNGFFEDAEFYFSISRYPDSNCDVNSVELLNEYGLKHMEIDISYETTKKTEDFYKAEKYFSLAIELDNKFPNSYANRGNLYLKKYKLYDFPKYTETYDLLNKSIKDLKYALRFSSYPINEWNKLLLEAETFLTDN